VERVEVRGVGGECLRRYLLEPWAAGGQDEPVGLHHLPSLTRQADIHETLIFEEAGTEVLEVGGEVAPGQVKHLARAHPDINWGLGSGIHGI